MRGPFENDTILEDKLAAIIKSFKVDCVIETGTETGATAQWFAGQVPKVYTCDIEDKLECLLPENVSFSLCSSHRMLDNLLPTQAHNYSRILFWLDAHVAPSVNMLPRELHLIATHRVQNPIVCIHDFRVPNHPELGFDTYDDFGPLAIETVEELIHPIFPYGWRCHYNKEAKGAQRGVAFFFGQ